MYDLSTLGASIFSSLAPGGGHSDISHSAAESTLSAASSNVEYPRGQAPMPSIKYFSTGSHRLGRELNGADWGGQLSDSSAPLHALLEPQEKSGHGHRTFHIPRVPKRRVRFPGRRGRAPDDESNLPDTDQSTGEYCKAASPALACLHTDLSRA